MGNKSRLPLKTPILQLQSQAPFGRLIISETSKEGLPRHNPSVQPELPAALSLYTHSFQPERFNLEEIMNLKRKGGKGRVAMGATEFESVSGYHFGPKRKQLKPRNWQLQLLFVLFFKRKFHKTQFWGHEAKMFSAL